MRRATYDELTALLERITKGSGAFSHDPLTHAENCIESMKADAVKALAILQRLLA